MTTQTFPAVTVTVTTLANHTSDDGLVVVLGLGDKGTVRLYVRDGRLEAFGGGSAEADAILDALNR